MAAKILTVSVAAYNVESTIAEVLDSLIVPDILDRLEVFVIDDGGTDSTLKIAKEYEEKYPGTFFIVHKENGGYGSTVNYSIAHATGKYFKLLDGDDWFNIDNLTEFINLLEHEYADVIITPYVECGERSGKRKIDNLCRGLPEGCFLISQVKLNGSSFDMHYLTFRTDLIQSIPLKLTEYCFYTDAEYACLPIPYINTVYIWQHSIYQYRTEVAGQSMSISGMLKHYQEHEQVFWRLSDEYKQMKAAGFTNTEIFKERLSFMAVTHIHMLCLKGKGQISYKEVEKYCNKIKQKLPEIRELAMRQSKFVYALYLTRYKAYPVLYRYYQWQLRRKRKGD